MPAAGEIAPYTDFALYCHTNENSLTVQSTFRSRYTFRRCTFKHSSELLWVLAYNAHGYVKLLTDERGNKHLMKLLFCVRGQVEPLAPELVD